MIRSDKKINYQDYYHKGNKIELPDGRKRTFCHCTLCDYTGYAGGMSAHVYYKHGKSLGLHSQVTLRGKQNPTRRNN